MHAGPTGSCLLSLFPSHPSGMSPWHGSMLFPGPTVPNNWSSSPHMMAPMDTGTFSPCKVILAVILATNEPIKGRICFSTTCSVPSSCSSCLSGSPHVGPGLGLWGQRTRACLCCVFSLETSPASALHPPWSAWRLSQDLREVVVS